MKQLIVLIATIVLGAGISTIVIGFGKTATKMGTATDKVLTSVENTITTGAIN